jgi:toxin ParE1/3/4
MRLRFSSYVKYDLAEIADYIAEDSPAQALRIIRLLREGMEDAARQPELYRLRPELDVNARMVPVGSYVILFRMFEDYVRIERVVHGSRDLFNLVMGDR